MRVLIACILLLFFTTTTFAEPEAPQVVVAPIAAPVVVAPLVVPVFNADEADKSVVRITLLDGTFRGTGFYIGNKTVMSANHVTMNTPQYRTPLGVQTGTPTPIKHLLVWNKAGAVSLATVAIRNSEQDFATLTLEDDLRLVAVTFGEAPKRGDALFMVSHPIGILYSLSRGFLSRASGTIPDTPQIRGLASMLASSGSSGAPIFNARGEVVGILTQVLTYGTGVLFLPNSVFKDRVGL